MYANKCSFWAPQANMVVVTPVAWAEWTSTGTLIRTIFGIATPGMTNTIGEKILIHGIEQVVPVLNRTSRCAHAWSCVNYCMQVFIYYGIIHLSHVHSLIYVCCMADSIF